MAVVSRWPDHGQRTPGAVATAPDQGTGRPVRQGEGVAVLAGIMAVGLLHGSWRGILTGASGAPGRKPGLQGLTGRKPRPVVRGVPGHRGATEDQGSVLLPDRGSRGPLGGSLILGLILGQRPGGGVVPRWPDHGRRTPGAAATAPDRDTGRAVRQGEGGGAVFGAMPLQRVRPHRGIVSFWPHVQP